MAFLSRHKTGKTQGYAASESAALIADPLGGGQQYTPPCARELRAQTVQRLQLGLFGIATMLLLVSLASIIMQHAKISDTSPAAIASAKAGSSGGTTTGDPLADIGVVPSPDGTASHKTAAGQPANR